MPFSTTQPDRGENKEQRQLRNLDEARRCIKRRFETEEQVLPHEGEPQLWLAGECWSRNDRDGSENGEEGLTLVVSAANGFTKEVSLLP